MKNISISKMLTAIKKADKIIAKNNTLVVLDNALLSKNSLMVSNLEIYGNFHVPNIDVEALVDYAFLKKVVSKWKTGEMTISVNDHDQVVLSKVGTKSAFTLNQGMSIGEFPRTPSARKVSGVLEGQDIQSMIRGLKYAGNDDLRPVMSGVYLDDDKVVATDAHRLMFIDKVSKLKHKFVTPNQVLRLFAVAKYNELVVTVNKDAEWVRFSDNLDIITVRAIDGRYPNWDAVVPKKSSTTMTIKNADIKALLEEIDMCSLAANQETHQVAFDITKNGVTASSEDVDFGRSYSTVLKAKRRGKDLKIGFNANFLKTLINDVVSDADIVFEMTEPNRAVVINNEALLMPVMLNE